MTNVGAWDPTDHKSAEYQIDLETLRRFAELGSEQQLATLKESLSAEQIDANRHLMRLHKDPWLKAAPALSDQQLINLVRFFTVAEMQLSGWEAENLSPVIWLCRTLKSRGLFPDKALTAWIKANSSNKFIPYGNLLDL